MNISKNKRKAFSLIELLVVVVIIAVITSLAVIVYDVSWARSRDSKRVSDIIRIQNALETYHRQEGRYPDSLTFGQSLIRSNTSSPLTYMVVVPENPAPRSDGDCPNQEYSYSTTTDFYGNDGFTLEFCLGDNSDQIAAGYNCATENGIIPGACSESNLKRGLQLWLKADGRMDTSFDAGTGDNYINSWYDDSDNGYVLTQSVANKRPVRVDSEINGQTVAIFNGSTSFLSGGDILDIHEKSWTVYVVGQAYSDNGTYLAKSLYGSLAGRWSTLYYGGQLLYLYQDNTDLYNVAVNRAVGSWEITTTERDTTAKENRLYANFSLLGTTPFSTVDDMDNSSRFLVGAYNNNPDTSETLFLNGAIAEILIYDRILTDTEKTLVQNYLEEKYGF